jgi:bifunctional UDP-N-acetylglucosamine pyrophosphorylase/glucosamine-1-phosphate N-acetyltransferase
MQSGMMSNELALVIMAAGKGRRMRSRRPKVLHSLCGQPLIRHSIAMGRELGAKRIVIVAGHGIEAVREALAGDGVEIVEQSEQLGTAHAALQAGAALTDHEGPVLVMNGDHPLYRASTLQLLIDAYAPTDVDLAILVTEMPDPTGYGRVVRDADGRVERIVEERDAEGEMREIREVNLGAYLADGAYLLEALRKIGNDNAQGEYYLTDLVEIARRTGGAVGTASTPDHLETMGINDRAQLAEAERLMRRRINERWMLEGVTLVDPVAASRPVSSSTHRRSATAAGSSPTAGSSPPGWPRPASSDPRRISDRTTRSVPTAVSETSSSSRTHGLDAVRRPTTYPTSAMRTSERA